MRRREFIALVGGVTAWPVAGRAESPLKVRRVAFLSTATASAPGSQERFQLFVQTLRDLRWTDGKNIQFDVRWAEPDAQRYREYAAELVKLAPNVIVVVSSAVLLAVRKEAGSIPIVFMFVSDPDGQGFVQSLARPGGNITGFVHFEYSFSSKWLQLLKETAPHVARVLVIYNPKTMPTVATPWLQQPIADAPALGIELGAAPMESAAELKARLTDLARTPGGGLIVLPDPFTSTHRDAIVQLAARLRLPAIYPFKIFAEHGGLISYGSDATDLFRRSASYVDRILRGEKPADLPVQQPTKFELVINLKTAKALGLTVPATLLARADEVIE